ncbi:hypothetical protein [Fictibacillus enclensis]|uniref:hypothetical protein n=1 Tax=Fictibacillus enclensis TaxID=1017270 RepID=UPI0025A28374|nr:hypothetical protein [Fictibacillus enclensis]
MTERTTPPIDTMARPAKIETELTFASLPGSPILVRPRNLNCFFIFATHWKMLRGFCERNELVSDSVTGDACFMLNAGNG